MRGPARFRSSQRLSGGDISRILASGRRIKVEPILAHVLSNGLPWARLGVVVPKRQFRRAVDRNRIRRQLREWFRLNQETLAGRDILLRVGGPLDANTWRASAAARLLGPMR